MDVCDICFDPPRPLETLASGTVLLDAVDGERRLLGELAFREPVRLHFIEVAATRRVWTSEDWVLCAVTVYNRSSLPLQQVFVDPGAAAFLDGTVRVNGVPAGDAGAVILGLGPGCAAVVTWELCASRHLVAASLPPARCDYEYRFAGAPMAGTTYSHP